jgi:hypothetical protein
MSHASRTAVRILVGLQNVRDERAVIGAVRDAVVVVVRVADVPQPVVVVVLLAGIGVVRAVVAGSADAVGVLVEDVAATVMKQLRCRAIVELELTSEDDHEPVGNDRRV